MSETNISEMSGHADSTIPETLKEKLHYCEALCKELENLAGCPGVDVQAECGRLQNEFENALDLPPEFEELHHHHDTLSTPLYPLLQICCYPS